MDNFATRPDEQTVQFVRILRADTAALAALAIWQSVAGDFQERLSQTPDLIP